MTTYRTAYDVLGTPNEMMNSWQIEYLVNAKQGLLADLLALPEMQDETASGYGSVTYPIDTRSRIGKRNEIRGELRHALSVYFMGGDVGVDMGDSDSPELHEQSEQVKSVSEVRSKRKDG